MAFRSQLSIHKYSLLDVYLIRIDEYMQACDEVRVTLRLLACCLRCCLLAASIGEGQAITGCVIGARGV